MKKNVLFITTVLTVLSFNVFGQLFINNSGYVGINQSVPQYNFDFYGTGRLWSTGWGAILFNASGPGNVATLHPNEDWTGCLGTHTKRFNELNVHHVRTIQLTYTSDYRLKQNIQKIQSPLHKILSIRGIQYDYAEDLFKVDNPKVRGLLIDKSKNKIGFLAQEIKEVFPQLVFQDPESDEYSVDYVSLIPVLVEAMKEQQAQIEELKILIQQKK